MGCLSYINAFRFFAIDSIAFRCTHSPEIAELSDSDLSWFVLSTVGCLGVTLSIGQIWHLIVSTYFFACLILVSEMQLNKSYSRDFLQPGRVRVQIKREDGSPVNPAIPNRKFPFYQSLQRNRSGSSLIDRQLACTACLCCSWNLPCPYTFDSNASLLWILRGDKVLSIF